MKNDNNKNFICDMHSSPQKYTYSKVINYAKVIRKQARL